MPKLGECSFCADTGFIIRGGRRYACQCQKERRRTNNRKYSGIPNFTRHEITPPAESYVRNFRWIQKSEKNWIAFTGRSGTGKTTQAFLIGDALVSRDDSVRVRAFHFGELVRELSALRYDAQEYEKKINDVLCAEVVIFDDFLQTVPKAETFEEQVVLELINRVYKAKLPLILTSEKSVSIMYKVLRNHGESLVGRIVEMCDGRIYHAGPECVNYRLHN